MDKTEQKTKQVFSFAWKKFGQKEVQKNWEKDSYHYYQWFDTILKNKSKYILDAGCGGGADILKWITNSKFIVGLDLSDAVFVAKENTKKYNNKAFIQASLLQIPFKKNSFDLVYSFGVLHHIKNTEKAIKEIYNILKHNGYFIVYLYENLKEKSLIRHYLLQITNIFRSLIKLLPPKSLYIFCILFSIPVYLFLTIPAYIFKLFGLTKIYKSLPYHHTLKISTIISDIFDRFSPPIEKRYTKQQAIKLLEKSGFKIDSIHNYRGWVIISKK